VCSSDLDLNIWDRQSLQELCESSTAKLLGLNVIVGKGEEKSNKEMIKLEKVMVRLGLTKGDKVKFFGGLENKDLPKIYSQATVFVNTSENEGICFSFLEAMAFKIPILAWDVGGNSTVIENEVTGYLYDFGDIERMSIGILKLVSKRHIDLRKKMGIMAFNKLKKEFDIKKNVQKLLRVYQEALG
jgi:glycosyltransferase involved in cell wall biosynthesis